MQIQIDQHHVGPMLLERAPCGLDVVDAHEVVPEIGDERRHRLADVRIVLDEKHARHIPIGISRGLRYDVGVRASAALVFVLVSAAIVATGCATGAGDGAVGSIDKDAGVDVTLGDGAKLDSSGPSIDSGATKDATSDTTDTSTAPVDAADPCPGKKLCAGKCIDLTNDVDHCGGCDQVCPDRANATRTCNTAVCGFACNTGFDDCNKVPLDGCEIATSSALDNCGSCGKACPTGVGATPHCTAGTCSLTCNSGFGDCDGTPGCETNTTTSTTNCGACGKVCPSGATTDATCSSGTCGTTCKSGFVSTSGFCSNVAGAFATNPGCSGCGNANPYTSGCSCPSGFSPTGAFVARTDACGITGSTIQFCESGGAAVGVWGGAFQTDDPVSCGIACRSANAKTGGCSCPAGYNTEFVRVLITNGCGSKIGSQIGICVHPTVALDDFGGVYQVDDAVPGGAGCRVANVRTGDCSCPSGFGASAVRTLVDSSSGEIGAQLFTCFR